jgi:hypothetical protein
MDNLALSKMVNAVKFAIKIKSLSFARPSHMCIFTDRLFGESTKVQLKSPFRLHSGSMTEMFGFGFSSISERPCLSQKLFGRDSRLSSRQNR